MDKKNLWERLCENKITGPIISVLFLSLIIYIVGWGYGDAYEYIINIGKSKGEQVISLYEDFILSRKTRKTMSIDSISKIWIPRLTEISIFMGTHKHYRYEDEFAHWYKSQDPKVHRHFRKILKTNLPSSIKSYNNARIMEKHWEEAVKISEEIICSLAGYPRMEYLIDSVKISEVINSRTGYPRWEHLIDSIQVRPTMNRDSISVEFSGYWIIGLEWERLMESVRPAIRDSIERELREIEVQDSTNAAIKQENEKMAKLILQFLISRHISPKTDIDSLKDIWMYKLQYDSLATIKDIDVFIDWYDKLPDSMKIVN